MAHGGIGRQGAAQLGIAAQLHRDLEAFAAEGGQQGLSIGLEQRRIGAGPAEHLGQQAVATGQGEQLGKLAGGR